MTQLTCMQNIPKGSYRFCVDLYQTHSATIVKPRRKSSNDDNDDNAGEADDNDNDDDNDDDDDDDDACSADDITSEEDSEDTRPTKKRTSTSFGTENALQDEDDEPGPAWN